LSRSLHGQIRVHRVEAFRSELNFLCHVSSCLILAQWLN
jgi:hypothetical protein